MLASMLERTLNRRDSEDRMGLKESLAKGVDHNLDTDRGLWMDDQDQASLLAFLLDFLNRREVWWPEKLRERRKAR